LCVAAGAGPHPFHYYSKIDFIDRKLFVFIRFPLFFFTNLIDIAFYESIIIVKKRIASQPENKQKQDYYHPGE
jgi:hypothetical protein